jgi:hypothetical protein
VRKLSPAVEPAGPTAGAWLGVGTLVAVGTGRASDEIQPGAVGTQPLVSVIINNYNYGRFLRSAIESVLGQSYSKLELIVVDDGSTDSSRTILETYGDLVITILKENGGQASALNAGFARCHGEIVFFLDSDDVLLPTIVQHVVRVFEADASLAKVHYRMAVIDVFGRHTSSEKPPQHITMLDGDLRRHYLTFPDDVWRLPTSGNAFPAWLLRRICPIPEAEYLVCADTYFTHLAPLFGRVQFLDDVGACYRLHGGNSYEVADTMLNLTRIRRDITLSCQTHKHLSRFAHAQGFAPAPNPAHEILSVSYIVNRMISVKLQPMRHIVPGDTPARLLVLGIQSSMRRFDVSPPLKGMYILWFALMALAPYPIAWRLSVWMVFPQTRPYMNKLLKVLQRG